MLDFFWKFSAFECALKREGFLRKGPTNGAEADWDRFASEVKQQFACVSTPGFRAALVKLQTLAPRRQVVRNDRLAWDPVLRKATDSDAEYILRLLRTSRNNLFHGGKYPDGPIEEVARNRDILRAALAILDGCYEIHAGVKKWIDEAHEDISPPQPA